VVGAREHHQFGAEQACQALRVLYADHVSVGNHDQRWPLERPDRFGVNSAVAPGLFGGLRY
jgi:hypothetical protein